MLFKRRDRYGFGSRLRDVLWPRSGWNRTVRYVGHRIARLPGTPHSISLGLAIGAAVSFTPLIGLHVALAVLLTWVLRGNMVAAILGTLIGNPWTLPIFWVISYKIGIYILGDSYITEQLVTQMPSQFGISYFIDNFWGILFPRLIGSLPMVFTAGLATYFISRHLVRGYHYYQAQKRLKKRIQKAQALPEGPLSITQTTTTTTTTVTGPGGV